MDNIFAGNWERRMAGIKTWFVWAGSIRCFLLLHHRHMRNNVQYTPEA